jgi:RNA polymerase sigma factor, sigma-70 family
MVKIKIGGIIMNHFEIEACVIRAKNGNKEELLKILEQYKPFIFKTAKGFNINGYDIYDLVQIGYVALINAVAKYRTGSNTFSTYAYNSIKNAFRYTGRTNLKHQGDLSLNAPVNEAENNTTEFIDCIESEDNLEEDIVKLEGTREIRKAVSKLPSDEMELVIMVYYSGCSLKTYAEKTGLSYQQVTRKKKRILKKLECNLTSTFYNS